MDFLFPRSLDPTSAGRGSPSVRRAALGFCPLETPPPPGGAEGGAGRHPRTPLARGRCRESREEGDHALRDDALAAARLAHQADDLATADREAHLLHGRGAVAARRQRDAEVLHLKDRSRSGSHAKDLGIGKWPPRSRLCRAAGGAPLGGRRRRRFGGGHELLRTRRYHSHSRRTCLLV